MTRLMTKVLVIEDNPGDARLIREMFNESGSPATELGSAASMSEAEAYLATHSVDIILLDLGLPDAQGLGAVRRAHNAAPHVALVVLTGLDDESVASLALQEGAQDYLIKGQIEARGLMRALRYGIERKEMEESALAMTRQMKHDAQHDFLSGLPNRSLLGDRLQQAIGLAARNGNQVAVLFLDLDAFKHINDSLGHPVGDRLLQSVAKRLVGCVRGCDTVSRQGGDEFVILLSGTTEAWDVSVTARRMLEVIAGGHAIDHHNLHITASIGVSLYPDDGLTAEALIRNADTAMYQAKESGRNSCRFFKADMNVRAVERQHVEQGLRAALDAQEFVLHYQPKIDLESGAVTGAEALIRWQHPTRGLVPPGQFIPVAEDSGLILPIGNWALREACRQAQAWVDAGLPRTTMAVNISAIEFGQEKFLEGVFDILQETGLDPSLLELELTESVLMKRVDTTASILQILRESGVRVSVDDFGTGYSSLSYLQRFPVDALKIDQSFVRQISVEPDGARAARPSQERRQTTIVTAVIDMARSLRLKVIAEGVETLEQLEFLRQHHCHEAQGYFFSRPVPAEEFALLLRSGFSERAGVRAPVAVFGRAPISALRSRRDPSKIAQHFSAGSRDDVEFSIESKPERLEALPSRDLPEARRARFDGRVP